MTNAKKHVQISGRVLPIALSLVMAFTLTLSSCLTVFGSSDVNTDSDTESCDGSYTFTGDGDWYGYESYLNEDYEAEVFISGRIYMVTLPEDGRLQVEVSVDKETFLEARVSLYEGNYIDEQKWLVGNAQHPETLNETSAMLAAGTHRVVFDYRRWGGDVVPYWPPGKKTFFHKVTFKALSADEKAAFSVIKETTNLFGELGYDSSAILDHEASVLDLKASYEALTDSQKAYVSSDTVSKIENYVSEIESAKKAAEEEAKMAEEEAVPSQTGVDDGEQTESESSSYNNEQERQEDTQNEAAALKAKKKKTTGFKTSAKKKGRIALSWKKTSGVTGYQIYRSTKKTKGFKRVATIKKSGTKKWTDKKTKAKKTYYYKIRPYTMIDGKKVPGKWSTVKKVKAKK